MIDKKVYDVARRNLSERQAFLDGIDMEKYAPFVRRIKNHDRDKISGKFMMGTNSCFNFGRQATIHVANSAFDNFSSAEFYNSLVHHEGVHAKKLYYNPLTLEYIVKNIVGRILKKPSLIIGLIEMEIEAYENQTKHPSFIECSPKYQKNVRNISEYLVGCHKKAI